MGGGGGGQVTDYLDTWIQKSRRVELHFSQAPRLPLEALSLPKGLGDTLLGSLIGEVGCCVCGRGVQRALKWAPYSNSWVFYRDVLRLGRLTSR